MKKTAEILNRGIDSCFSLMMIMILVATLLIDKYISNPFPNTVRYANGGYYLFAVFFLLYLLKIAKNRGIRDEKSFHIVFAGIAVTALVVQVLISCWFPVEIGADFTVCKNAAIELAKGGTLKEMQYFQMYPNNVNITILFSVLYVIFGSWRAVILLGALSTNLSVLLASWSVYNCTGNKMACLITESCGMVLAAFTWRAFIPYSDNYGMVFVSVIIWAYTSHFRNCYKASIILASALFGGVYIKATVCIPLLAVTLHLFIRWLDSGVKRVAWKNMALCGIGICIAFAGIRLTEKAVRGHFGYISKQAAFGWQCQFMLGQNDKYYGTVNDADIAFAKTISDSGKREQICLNEGLRRIVSRKLLGNAKFYMGKLNVAFNDGYFNNVQWNYDGEDNFWSNLYLRNGAYYALGADVLQILWDFILIVSTLGIFLKTKKLNVAMFQILLLGVTFYLLIFQNRSKYLYMFLPVYIAYAGNVLSILFDRVLYTEQILCKESIGKKTN